MTLLSSGTLALQDAGTNPTDSTTPLNHNTSFTTGLDGLLQMQQLNEVGDGQFVVSTVWQGDAYGYNLNMFSTSYIHQVFDLSNGPGIGNRRYQNTSNFGSLGDTTYSDDNSITRTISGVFWGLPDASPNNVRLFIFGMGGTSVPNADTTWEKIEIITSGGTTVTINRTDLSYDASENGDTFWYWKGSSGTMYTNLTSLGTPSSGTSYTLKVYGDTVTTTVNNGIAEEYGGADSSNVALSDYYRTPGGTLHNTAGIPTSGEIKFSDFLGTTKVDIQTAIMGASMTAGYSSSQYHQSSGFNNVTGSASGTNLSGTVGGQTGVICSTAMNTNGIMYLYFIKSGFSGTFTNTGWTSVNYYLDQHTNSGSPDLTILRTAFTFSSSNGTAYYSYDGSYAIATYFGSSGNGKDYFVEIL